MSAVARATGRHLHHDPASRAYAAPPRAMPTKSWLHPMGPVLDQGQINGCTGWSGADWLNWPGALPARRRYNAHVRGTFTDIRKPYPNAYLTDADGLWIYQQATQCDTLGWTYPPADKGSTGLGVAKALQKAGVIPNYLWTFDFPTMLSWAARQPVLLGTAWTEPMSNPDAKGVITVGGDLALKRADNAGIGHEYVLRGVNLRTGLARIRNHWTAGWGLHGDALIPLTELETLVIRHGGDVCVPLAAAA